MQNNHFRGTGVAIVTPFQDGKVDFKGLEKVLAHVIDGGVDYIVALGSTGETTTLSEEEARNVLNFVIEKIAGRKPLVAGNFGGNSTSVLRSKIKSYDFTGIDAILCSNPAYVKPSQEGIYHHYMAIEKVCPVPIILYNVPGRTMSNISHETTVRLANASKKFIGIKEASGDLIQITRVIKNKPDHFFVTSGDDEIALPMTTIGGDGVISVMANALPTLFSKMIHAALDGRYDEARALNFKTYDLHKWLYIEGNPVGIKSAMEILGICSNEVRLPLYPLSKGNYDALAQELRKIIGV